jgi:hypothetical protein
MNNGVRPDQAESKTASVLPEAYFAPVSPGRTLAFFIGETE